MLTRTADLRPLAAPALLALSLLACGPANRQATAPDATAGAAPSETSDTAEAAFDPGDTAETTRVAQLRVGDEGRGQLAGLTEAHNWRMDLGVESTVTIRVTGEDTTDPLLVVYDPAGEVLERVDDVQGPNPMLVLTAAESGTYTARVTAWGPGSYVIALAEGDSTVTTDELSGLPVHSGGDSYETTLVERLDPSTPQTVLMESLTVAHNWLFDGTRGSTVTLDVTGETDTVDLRLRLLGPEGNELATADDEDGRNPQLTYTLSRDGIYTARLDAWEAGEYTVTLLVSEIEATPGEELRQWGLNAEASSQYGLESWSARRAAGEPDTQTCGDLPTAWASSQADGEDWLAVGYAVAVIPRQINIRQSFNPGAVVRVEVAEDPQAIPGGEGEPTVVYEAEPSLEEDCPSTLTIDIEDVGFAVARVIVHLDQSEHPGWNEIDAVELVGTVP